MGKRINVKKLYLLCIVCYFLIGTSLYGQSSVARQWNELLLTGIRGDFARPTVHARNLMHLSIALYDTWAVFDNQATTYFLGKSVYGFDCPFEGIQSPQNLSAARTEAMSYAAYRIIYNRFLYSPRAFITIPAATQLLNDLGYDETITSTDYSTGSPAALGNYLAEQILKYGLQDGSNEGLGFENQYYQPANLPLEMDQSGNSIIMDPNRWQPLSLAEFIDQSGNPIPGGTPDFLSPEWGNVLPFALKETDLTTYTRDGSSYKVYHDPGLPPNIGINETWTDEYKWGFALVSAWGAHLDPADGVMIDISPASIGNNPPLPTSIPDYRSFYDFENGGDASQGHSINPKTGQPYTPQVVPRADYARVLAEFWADGPESETPPGHWFTILNYVNDHPQLIKKFRGQGELMDDLEWDVKSYFALAGAMHDAAISAWGIKGWYDYIRPVSAIRFMADHGQDSDPNAPNYHAEYGIPLTEGLIELVEIGDTLAGTNNENVGKVKLYTWKGPDYITNSDSTIAGVGWILGENWWPYQRPSFVTPPFAGYVSGHSTYSRAAAEVLTMLTGDEYFPGGLGEFHAPKNEFLVFEDGPSVDLTLQWATYRDASDQTSLSRIWGGIHPPADDIPGRLIGEKIGIAAFELAETYFTGKANLPTFEEEVTIFPNPLTTENNKLTIAINKDISTVEVNLYNIAGQKLWNKTTNIQSHLPYIIDLDFGHFPHGMYYLQLIGEDWNSTQKILIMK